jgi:hypothetical protein
VLRELLECPAMGRLGNWFAELKRRRVFRALEPRFHEMLKCIHLE